MYLGHLFIANIRPYSSFLIATQASLKSQFHCIFCCHCIELYEQLAAQGHWCCASCSQAGCTSASQQESFFSFYCLTSSSCDTTFGITRSKDCYRRSTQNHGSICYCKLCFCSMQGKHAFMLFLCCLQALESSDNDRNVAHQVTVKSSPETQSNLHKSLPMQPTQRSGKHCLGVAIQQSATTKSALAQALPQVHERNATVVGSMLV